MANGMIITLSISADDFKLYQVLGKFAKKYKATYNLTRDGNNFELRIKTDKFGELTRRLNHIKDCSFQIQEIVDTPYVNSSSLRITQLNAEELIGKETIAQTNILPVEGGQITLLGQQWFTKPLFDKIIRTGSKVKVVKIEGVSLLVKKVNDK